MPSHMRSLVGSGTSPNEALHSELNRAFRNQPEVYIETLGLQLEVSCWAKRLAHNAAMYRPTLRSLSQQLVFASQAARLNIPHEEWVAFCSQQATASGTRAKADLPLMALRKAARPLASKWSGDKRAAALKRPSAAVALKRPAAKRLKRTPFTLKRVR